ncbi:regulatory protein RecX [Conexibacter sp. JD483]|uniref:regulatory protein RecX n=1 Tax=unclassified Conexibacter TaxID=2627773 RepID=UPI00271FA4A5|nr:MULTISPECIES: regulatory protein RecX [unclassified Conexibacter]MDO8188086.1 regulatory protein RecX [Conexibacter sp. CPCC 205706]MDO8196918.1 regulatory protein RecX [Conexibacter sp. CPCC 205762]MDR9370047.1 regulatory protein RecX [Conexibacter sp. JD483]
MSETTAEERLQHALELSFRYLGPRARTELEMRRHLEAKGVEPEAAEAALTSLLDQGYLDDARFAREFTEDKRLLEEWGADRIERRLLSLGIAPALVREVVGERGRGGESEAAQALLARRFPVLEDDPRELRRAIGVLVRKGYDSELAWDLVRAHARGGGFD